MGLKAVAGADPVSPKTPGGAAPAARTRLLLVEDHAPTRKSLARLLGRRNYEVFTAGSLAEARALGGQNKFELLISGIGLPDGDGYQVMAEMGKLHPGLSGIAINGLAKGEDREKSQRAGFAQYLVKPVRIPALVEAIARVLSPKTAQAASISGGPSRPPAE